MLHAPTSENGRDAARTHVVPEAVRELHHQATALSGQLSWPRKQQLARLHSVYGNQAVLRMLSRSTPTIQAKLTVNQPGDQYEQEADRVAEHVMRMPAPNAVQRSSRVGGQENTLQRKCAECEAEKKKELQREGDDAAPAVAPPVVDDVLSSPGEPLDGATRAFVEPRFGLDFGHVRVHADTRAGESAAAVNAKAYTVGQHVVFGRG